MERTPEEVLGHITGYLNDVSLLALSHTSRRWRTRINGRQILWRRRFELHFSQKDDNEREWLRQYKLVHAAKATVGNASRELDNPHSEPLFNWFDAYCQRCTAEYCWRHGLYNEHQFTDVADTRLHGTRLQSIPCVLRESAPADSVVASQWLLERRLKPVWILERPCWDGVDVDCLKIQQEWHSAEYLIIWTENTATRNRCSLYAWHLDSLDAPPRTIIADIPLINADVRDNWLIGGYNSREEGNQCTLFVANLAEGSYCSKLLSDFRHSCILRATEDSVHIVCVNYGFVIQGPITLTCEVWQVAPNQSILFQCQVTENITVYRSFISSIRLVRVDDDRLTIFTNYFDSDEHTSVPTLVLAKTASNTASVSLKEEWGRAVGITHVKPIVSRNLLGTGLKGYWSLLNLSDGTEVHRLYSDCWRTSGLYPLEKHWERIDDDEAWPNPDDSPLGEYIYCQQKASPTAIFRNGTDIISIGGYAEHARKPKRLTDKDIDQMRRMKKELASLTDYQEQMLEYWS
ncbi:hypothetical protein THASP1DRAFT_30780 [Thamnocephalis sphaerospora]|uniref:F-box domain-containing protein n=1 Tax=Thamnocephalis sphaerospora TaxID=78915 RepID=A0A4V1IWF7_9FUNG|nr:hypothetical protein THASP1DRAFT_30780 [Thamnocephalis sphaerospora]|eukprot:RKP07399.1 hypothetical protein THASP1DRAFT_30780 [Thamnocephalis sphaerospora]